MANDTIRTCPLFARKDGFTVVKTPPGLQMEELGIADTVVITKGDALIFNTDGALALATDGGATATNFAGVADNTVGSATSTANATLKCRVIPPHSGLRFWAKVGTGTAAATDVGEIIDFADEDSLDVTDVSTGGWGFKVLAVDSTNNYVYGNWERG